MPFTLKLAFGILLCSCSNSPKVHFVSNSQPNSIRSINPYASIAEIPTPPGYYRAPAEANSFTTWLRHLPLKKGKTVFLFNGQPKRNQQAQFAVLDISTDAQGLQQCADAVIRLRAEYLYSRGLFDAIDFTDNNNKHYKLNGSTSRTAFDNYLEKVFAYCGTLSLEKQLIPVNDINSIAAGDVLIHGGSPGHAMQVIDVAINNKGEKLYLLAQGYMPAQDMHVVVNPQNSRSPWYEAKDLPSIVTPEWIFTKPCLKRWAGLNR